VSLVILMRHGEALNNVQHILTGRTLVYHLTERGRLHVNEVVEMLKPLCIEYVYTSPITRAVETAEIVSNRLNLPFSIDERLTETDMGRLTGMSYFEVLDKYRDLLKRFYNGEDVSDYGLENFTSIKARILSMLDYVTDRHRGVNTLLITHLDVIKAVIAELLKVSADVLLDLKINTASLTILKHSSSYQLLAYNVLNISRYKPDD
jgi:probable phosphoglycerate mutase